MAEGDRSEAAAQRPPLAGEYVSGSRCYGIVCEPCFLSSCLRVEPSSNLSDARRPMARRQRAGASR